MAEPNVYRFERFVLDVPNRRLTRRGVEIYLPPKTFETLLVLVQRHGQFVTKGALLDAVWNDTGHRNALTRKISELREALEDDARQPRFIRTVPHIGFTFVASVERERLGLDAIGRLPSSVTTRADTEWPPAHPFREGDGRRFRMASSLWVALATAAVVVAAGSGWSGARPYNRLSRLELVSSLPGLHRSPSLSPDRRTVAFISDRSGILQVWIKTLGGGAGAGDCASSSVPHSSSVMRRPSRLCPAARGYNPRQTPRLASTHAEGRAVRGEQRPT